MLFLAPLVHGLVANQVGCHALTWVGGWSPEEARRAIAGTRHAGFDLIEIPLLDPSSVDTGMTRSLLGEYGLGVTTSLGLSTDADISSESASVAAKGEALLQRALQATSELGAPVMCGVLYSALEKYKGPLSAAGRASVVTRLRRLAAEADAVGVTLALEVVNRLRRT